MIPTGVTGGLWSWLTSVADRLVGRRRVRPRDTVAFTSAFVPLAAKLAKADGIAVQVEWDAFERFLEVPDNEVANVRRVYDRAAEDTAGADALVARMRDLLKDDEQVRRDVIDCLLYIACSDGILHPAEDAFLAGTAATLGYTREDYRRIRALFVHDADSPYDILGVSPDATDAAIKTRYRAAAFEMHPDRLMASGAPAAVVKAATAKLASINAAYEAILVDRRRDQQ